MPYFNNPDLLGKERLKEELRNNGIQIPTGNLPKTVLVDLYLTHLSAKNKDGEVERSEFSDDEPLTPKKSPRKASKKKMSKKFVPPVIDVESLSDEELFAELQKLGETPGPITETTRRLYEKKLAKLLADPTQGKTKREEVVEVTEEVEEFEVEYSDEEDVDVEEEDEEPSSQEEIVTVIETDQTDAGEEIKTVTTTTTTKLTKRIVKPAEAPPVETQTAERHPVTNYHHSVTETESPPKAKSGNKFWLYLFLFVLILAVMGALVYHHMEDNPFKRLPSMKPPTTTGKNKQS